MNTKPIAWYQWRRTGIGSSDAPAIVGVSPYRTAADVYWSKLDETPPREELSPALEWGTRLEEVVVAKVEEELGWQIVRPNVLALVSMFPEEAGKTLCFQCPVRPWQLASLDGALVGQPEMVEAKTARADSRLIDGQRMTVWGPSGSTIVPPDYYIQVQHQLAVTGWNKCHLAVLIGGSDFRLYEVLPDLEVIAELVAAEEKFWVEHVVPRVPPAGAVEPEGLLREKLLALPRRIETLDPASEPAALLRSYRETCLQVEQMSEMQEQAKLALQRMLIERGVTGFSVPCVGRVTWTPTKGRVVTNWEAVARQLNASAPLIQQHTETKPGHMTFRAKWEDEE